MTWSDQDGAIGMKPFAWACAGAITAAGMFTTFAAHAQVVIGADEIRPGHGGAYRDSYAAVPLRRPPDDSAMMSPQELIGFLRADGYSPLGPAMRRGWVYTIAVLNENGDDGRLIVDGRTGEPIRFIPAMRVDARLNEELDSMYGPPGPPPAAFASDPYMRRAPRPPASIPKVAKTPAAQPHVQTAAKPTGTPESAAAPKAAPAVAAAPASAPVTAKDTSQLPAETAKSDATKSDAAKSDAAKSDTAKSDTKPAETVAQAAPAPSPSTTGQAKPADGKPAPLQLKPTQEMPPVQPLD
jgi:hypothetical protein